MPVVEISHRLARHRHRFARTCTLAELGFDDLVSSPASGLGIRDAEQDLSRRVEQFDETAGADGDNGLGQIPGEVDFEGRRSLGAFQSTRLVFVMPFNMYLFSAI